jgi:alcohol dehydrogenase (NADP+)
MTDTRAYAAFDAKSPLRPYRFARREPGAHDVQIEILYCGVCHSDLHQVRNEWDMSSYPMVPGHEIVGRVSRAGAKVTRFSAGDSVGVGCFVDSCRTCPSCRKGEEQYCSGRLVFTYNSKEKDGKTRTQGGYSSQIVVDENYVLRLAQDAQLDRVAPLLCAGITTYSPMKHWKLAKGQKVAVLGLGGLGHMAVKYAVALGAEVTLLSSSPSKRVDAARLGAHDFALTSNEKTLAALDRRFNLLIDTVSAPHDIARYAEMLDTDGVMVLLGAPEKPASLPAFALIPRRRSIVGSLIGGIQETQEMLDFSSAHGITADVETIRVQDIDRAYERMLKADVRYRFVIDTSSLKET